jgi:hypothetical protein
LIAQVRDLDVYAILDWRDVELIPPQIRNERVGDRHVASELDQPDREVRSDEAEASGHERTPIRV